jgi:SsrA-binding protein
MAGSGGATKAKEEDVRVKEVAGNRKAYHDFFVEEKYEAGIELQGTEIKSVRDGRITLKDGYVRIEQGEAWLWNIHISAYTHAGKFFQHDPIRKRRLLLHKSEIIRLAMKTQAQGYTLIPLRMYLKKGRAKIEIGLARGKKLYDKRDALAERDANLEIQRAIRGRY